MIVNSIFLGFFVEIKQKMSRSVDRSVDSEVGGTITRVGPGGWKDFDKREISIDKVRTMSQEIESSGTRRKVSNQNVLAITTILFGTFVVAEVIGALVTYLSTVLRILSKPAYL